MRKVIFFACISLLFAAQYATAQDDVYESGKPQRPLHETKTIHKKHKSVDARFCRKLYVGFSMGINNPGGIIGLDVDVPVSRHIAVGAGYGPSTWGDKFYIDGKYYFRPCHRGFAIGVGVTHNTGNNNFTENLETINGTEDVTLKLKAQTNAFVGAYYFWTLGRRYNRLFVQAGYSIPFATYSYTEVNGDPLDNVGEAVVKLLSPGGFMMGVGFSFGAIH